MHIPAGKFLMGSRKDDPESDGENMASMKWTYRNSGWRVTVTVAQFRLFAESANYQNFNQDVEDPDNRPVRRHLVRCHKILSVASQ